ncbi:MAG: hypothetical protein ACOCT8_02210 [Actinomycetota bacterium]
MVGACVAGPALPAAVALDDLTFPRATTGTAPHADPPPVRTASGDRDPIVARAASDGLVPADLDPGEPGDDGDVSAELSQETVVTNERSAAAAGDGVVTDLIWVAQPIHAAHPDGDNQGLCRGWRWIAADTQTRATQLRAEGQQAYDTIWDELLAREAPGAQRDLDCPAGPFEGVGAIALRDTVRSTVAGQLPRPEPSIAPGYALTGLPAYLDTGTGHALTYDRSLTVAVGPFAFDVTVSATGASQVDWGDGSATEVHLEPGRPYPDGMVHHTYRYRGRVEVTVTDRWTIDFVATDAAGASVSDTVEASLAPEVLADLPVHGYRAVRVSPDPPS